LLDGSLKIVARGEEKDGESLAGLSIAFRRLEKFVTVSSKVFK
jgi:hypothetical protein